MTFRGKRRERGAKGYLRGGREVDSKEDEREDRERNVFGFRNLFSLLSTRNIRINVHTDRQVVHITRKS